MLLFLGLTVPYNFPLTFPFVFLYFIVFLFNGFIFGSVTFRVNSGLILFYLCILSYFFGMVLNHGVIYQGNIPDLLNIVTMILLPLILGTVNDDTFRRFVRIYHVLVVPLALFVGVFSLHRLYLRMAAADYAALVSALDRGTNPYALGMLLGLYAAFVCFWESKSAFLKTFSLLTVLVCLGAIGFSGSRRGWLILCGVAVYLIVKGVKRFLMRLVDSRVGLTVSKKKIWTVLCVSVMVAFLCWGAWSYTNKVVLGGISRLEKLEVRFKSIFSGERSSADPFAERSEFWSFAGELIEDRTVLEILFGSGFQYLTSYGERFPGVKRESDPHNFMISAMLYSGLVGVFLMLALISCAFFKLYKNRKTYGSEFFLVFLTTLFFWSVGGNSLFSVKILPVVILTILSVENGKHDETDLLFSGNRK